MEERTFHLFSQLPLELREHIWKMAMRPDKPGVQIFRVYDPESDSPGHAKDIMGLSVSDPSQRRRGLPPYPPCAPRLALPLWNKYPESVDDTSDQNISTYLSDGSLLTACQESRSMMKRMFGTNKASREIYDKSRAAYYFSGGTPSYIAIYPKTDLIILQFDDIFNFEWDYLEDLLYQKGSFHPDIRHIGIEYNERWGIELFEEDQNGNPWIEPVDFALYKLFELAEQMIYLSIWLIDHNLKRRKDAHSFKASDEHEFCNPYLAAPFYAKDRKFLKVNLEQGEQCLDQWQYIKPMPDGDYRKSSLHFANRLRKQVCDHACRESCVVSHCSCYLGLLGWDDI
ncbi:hypothetical protein FANTH_7623 [Fusarium anthophilum]|uniref:2EXR domain-containing protein n=1 Tax=Fusarium anthophilum TaxID=48485 RepID=A0A8H4ZDP6_9HYPO|nr:hypothetical protein FANTH_7623 [Fusarium anthophilum]